ncbi:hypothetical protein ACHAW6_002382 [Cyclotella cf. meneghiniana]
MGNDVSRSPSHTHHIPTPSYRRHQLILLSFLSSAINSIEASFMIRNSSSRRTTTTTTLTTTITASSSSSLRFGPPSFRRRAKKSLRKPADNNYFAFDASAMDVNRRNLRDDDIDDDGERPADDLITRYDRMMTDPSSGLAPDGTTATTTRVEEDGLLSPLPPLSSTTTTTTPSKEEEFDDTAWSIYSNTFFLSGGIFYLLATSWDYALFHANRSLSIDDALTLPQRVLYEFIWFMGPLTYLLNSIIDVRWAMKVRGRDGRRRELEKLLLGKNGRTGETTKKNNKEDTRGRTMRMGPTEYNDGMAERGEMEIVRYENHGLSSPLFDAVEASPLSSTMAETVRATPKRRKLHLRRMIVSPTRKIFHRMRKHMGHRRDLMAAITFGIAAALSVTGAICYLVSTQGEFSFVIHSSRDGYFRIDDDVLAGWAGGLERGSIHMYLVSAVFALWRNPWRTTRGGCGGGGGSNGGAVRYNGHPKSSSWIQTWIVRPFNDVDAMETVGDVFFGVASVVDVILEDSTLDDNVLWWPIVSAVLWTFDSLFYLRGDFVTLFMRKEVLSSEEDGDDVQMGDGFAGLDNGEDDVVVEDQGSVVQVWEYPVEGNGTENMVLS